MKNKKFKCFVHSADRDQIAQDVNQVVQSDILWRDFDSCDTATICLCLLNALIRRRESKANPLDHKSTASSAW